MNYDGLNVLMSGYRLIQ